MRWLRIFICTVIPVILLSIVFYFQIIPVLNEPDPEPAISRSVLINKEDLPCYPLDPPPVTSIPAILVSLPVKLISSPGDFTIYRRIAESTTPSLWPFQMTPDINNSASYVCQMQTRYFPSPNPTLSWIGNGFNISATAFHSLLGLGRQYLPSCLYQQLYDLLLYPVQTFTERFERDGALNYGRIVKAKHNTKEMFRQGVHVVVSLDGEFYSILSAIESKIPFVSIVGAPVKADTNVPEITLRKLNKSFKLNPKYAPVRSIGELLSYADIKIRLTIPELEPSWTDPHLVSNFTYIGTLLDDIVPFIGKQKGLRKTILWFGNTELAPSTSVISEIISNHENQRTWSRKYGETRVLDTDFLRRPQYKKEWNRGSDHEFYRLITKAQLIVHYGSWNMMQLAMLLGVPQIVCYSDNDLSSIAVHDVLNVVTSNKIGYSLRASECLNSESMLDIVGKIDKNYDSMRTEAKRYGSLLLEAGASQKLQSLLIPFAKTAKEIKQMKIKPPDQNNEKSATK